MGPNRKKPRTQPPSVDKPIPDVADAPSTLEPVASRTAGNHGTGVTVDLSRVLRESESQSNLSKQVKPKSSWYGTWPRKAAPSTSIARNTVLADKSTNLSSADLSRFEQKKVAPSRPSFMNVGKSRETSDITMGGTSNDTKNGTLETEEESQKSLEAKQVQNVPKTEDHQEEDQPKAVDVPLPETPSDTPPSVIPLRPAASSSWLGGWLSRSQLPPTEKQLEVPEESTVPDQPPPVEEHVESLPTQDPPVASAAETQPKAQAETILPAGNEVKPTSSWFGLWSAAAPSTSVEAPVERVPVKTANESEDTLMSDAPVVEEPAVAKAAAAVAPAAGSTWAFWSTEPTKKTADSAKQLQEAGELAVTGEVSQDQPELAKTATIKDNKRGKSTKRGRPPTLEIDDAAQKSSTSGISTPKAQTASSTLSLKASPPNLLIPSVRSTYKLAESPGILQQIARLVLQSHQRPAKHVFLVKEPPKIKKALAIGIHGLFPAAILRSVIGQPTGTSIRFANHAAEAIRRWTDKNGSIDCEIEKVALEGEGRISERVDNLWKLLLNWIDHVRQADFILIACHSQGVPVAMMLIAKLIEFGVVSTGRIGVCAMAGVSLGPFADYKSKLFSGSAGELFELANPESTVSKRYEDSLRIAMKYGVRVMYCGSIDDQLVSLESAIFAPVSHPYIYRSVFVDGRIHAPDFLSHLVGFALKLRNLGVPDHGLIRELSAPLAGSLYTGEGHSRLYDDGRVYDLAIEFSLETTSVGDVPLTLKKYEIATNANPYLLPWIMRGLLEEDFVKTELDNETTELLKQFDDWKPATKVLKDVKYRLEAVRSKL